jgi:hypothetical protein
MNQSFLGGVIDLMDHMIGTNPQNDLPDEFGKKSVFAICGECIV